MHYLATDRASDACGGGDVCPADRISFELAAGSDLRFGGLPGLASWRLRPEETANQGPQNQEQQDRNNKIDKKTSDHKKLQLPAEPVAESLELIA